MTVLDRVDPAFANPAPRLYPMPRPDPTPFPGAAAVTAAVTPPTVSVVVPAWNEAENIPLLVPRVAAALAGRPFEIIIVDDGSKDATVEVCRKLAEQYPVRLIVRDHPEHGLSGAVLHGIAAATGDTLAVMDADLQHPPERLPDLLAAVESAPNGAPPRADFALGSRYVAGGSTEGGWTLFRKLNSEVATALARPFAGQVKDPMSGFFALKRSTYARAERLTPLGYKIALELMCKCRVRQVQEVPIHFGLRTKGESKLSLKQQFRYLEHLSRLYDFTYPRASPIVKFAIATAVGFVVGLGVFLTAIAVRPNVTVATLLGYLGSIAVTAVFHARYVRTQRAFLVTPRPWLDFVVISVVELLAAVVAAAWLVGHTVGTPAVELFAIAFGVGLAVRYVLRKELLQDVRGLRRDPRTAEIVPAASRDTP
jgi:dolichol-phosphate mannosyltransferase